jgi:hypothetical protein
VNGQFKYTAEKDADCIDETLCFTYKVKDCVITQALRKLGFADSLVSWAAAILSV